MAGGSGDRAIVIGGGIGGLALGAALRRVGIPAAVFERAPELVEVGAGLTLWSNAIKALRRIGLEDVVVRRGSILERAATMTAKGEPLSEMALGALSRRAGAPSLCIHRGDLQDVLAHALEPGWLHLGAACVDVEEDAEGVAARFADGRVERGAVLIGADGIHSVVRERLFGRSSPRYAGYLAYRGIARCQPSDLPRGVIAFGLGRGAQIGIQYVARDRIYWFATINATEGSAPARAGKKQPARDALRDWFPLVQTVLEATDEAALLCSDVIDYPPHWPWGLGRVTLLGDAVHPTTPNLGQGACQALEDAVVLADVLRREGLRAESLRAYERSRRKRTAMVTRVSWSMGTVFQWENPMAVWLRRLALRSWVGRRLSERLFGALLGYEVPGLSPLPGHADGPGRPAAPSKPT